MADSLRAFLQSIPAFDSWSHAEKIRFFGWFIHAKRGEDRFSSRAINGCYYELHIHPPNVSQFLSDMEKRSPKEAMRDSRGYYLHRTIRSKFDAKYGETQIDPTPKSEQVLPYAVVEATRGYYSRIIQQANGCYERGWFDACSVMIRKFVEILIIEVYEAHGESADIKDGGGNFFMLSELISAIQNSPTWNLGRESKASLPLIKQMGDHAAHNRRYVATKTDVDKILPGLRVIADELLHLSNLK